MAVAWQQCVVRFGILSYRFCWANIYLHYALTSWVHQWRRRHAIGTKIVERYADDSVVGLQRENDARRFLVALQKLLATFKLELHHDKTRLIRFGRHAASECQERGLGKPDTFDWF